MTNVREKSNKPKKQFWLMILFFVLGAVFIAVGLIRDETSFVLRRAINICLECIGIG